jgi:CPA2 family monovalent cation:H+ antiporter-2
MAAAIAPESYKEVMLFLATAGVVVPLFSRLRISPVLGFIGAGALLGPYGLGRLVPQAPWLAWFTIPSRDEIGHLAEFGVVFLLFMIGLELSFERLRRMRRLVFGLGSAQVLACGLALSVGLYLLGVAAAPAILVGVALALSSTAIVVPVLVEGRRLSSPAGRATFAVLLFQDLAVAPILFTIAVLGSGGGDSLAVSFLWSLGQAAVAVALIVGLGRLALRPLFHLVAEARSPELFMAASLLVVLATALTAAVSGLSMALGAFVAGLLLAETEYRRAIEAMIEPFKGLLLGVFFVSVGMGLDPSRLAATPILIVAAAVALVAVKGGAVMALCAAFRLPRPVAVESALLLAAGGEFAFVLIGAAMVAGLVPETLGQEALVVATVSMVAIPLLARVGFQINGRLARANAVEAAAPPPAAEPGRVVLAGFGRVGQLVAEMLARHKIPYIAVDADPARVAAERSRGSRVYFGDASNPEFLRVCGIASARALVVTLDAPRAIEAVVAAARAERPDLTIVARARDARHARQLYELGVDDAVPETIEAALQLSEAVLVDVGVPMGLVIASVHERRDEFRAILRKADGTGPRATEFRSRRTVGKAS